MNALTNLKRTCAIIALATAASGASADILLMASDNFDSYANGVLAGNNGGTGWAGAWGDPAPANSSVVSVSSPADDPMSGKAARFSGVASDAATRTLGSTLSRNILVEFKFQFDAGAVNNNDFIALWFGNSGGPNIGLKANCGDGSCTADIFARTSGGDAGGHVQNVAIGQTYSVMGYLQKTGNSAVYNRFDLWVDPSAEERATLTGFDAFDTGASSISSFNQIGFRTATLAANDALLIDDLSISRVPEPGTLALAGLALAALGARRRKVAAA